MDNNIVERLRESVDRRSSLASHGITSVRADTSLMTESADEIERLRQEVDLKGSRLDDALDEIERLGAEINSLVSAQSGWGRVPKVEAEIERLRAAGDALVAAIRNHDLREAHVKAWEEARRG